MIANFWISSGIFLSQEGYHVRTARDGKEALSEIQRNPPDVLFTDLIMPKISGEQLIRYVRDNPAFAPMVIVVVSGAILEYSGMNRSRRIISSPKAISIPSGSRF